MADFWLQSPFGWFEASALHRIKLWCLTSKFKMNVQKTGWERLRSFNYDEKYQINLNMRYGYESNPCTTLAFIKTSDRTVWDLLSQNIIICIYYYLFKLNWYALGTSNNQRSNVHLLWWTSPVLNILTMKKNLTSYWLMSKVMVQFCVNYTWW